MKFLPGTTIESNVKDCTQILNSIFLTGGITLSQVATITGLEAHTIQNWVKRKYIAPPINKKYDINQLCKMITINLLKDVFSMDDICNLSTYLNAPLNRLNEPPITDSELYFYFIEMVSRLNGDAKNIEKAIMLVLSDFTEPRVGTKKRLEEILAVMARAHLSVKHKQKALMLYKATITREH